MCLCGVGTDSPRSITPLSISPFSITPLSIWPFSISPLSISPFSTTPLCMSPFLILPLYISPFFISPLSIWPFSITPFYIWPFSITPLSISPFFIMPLSISPYFILPLSISPFFILPFSISPSRVLGCTYNWEVKANSLGRVTCLKELFCLAIFPSNRIQTFLQLAKTSPQGSHSEVADWCDTKSMIIHPARTEVYGDCHTSETPTKEQVNKLCQLAYLEIRRIGSIRHYLSFEATQTLVSSHVLSRLDYCRFFSCSLQAGSRPCWLSSGSPWYNSEWSTAQLASFSKFLNLPTSPLFAMISTGYQSAAGFNTK